MIQLGDIFYDSNTRTNLMNQEKSNVLNSIVFFERIIRELPLKMFFLILFTFYSFLSQSQTILNTERAMKDIDTVLNVSANMEGDFRFGNVELLQFNSSLLAGKKFNSNLIRAIFSYEYLAEDQNIINSDYSGQIRYNYLIDKNSIFTFIQGQNARALRMNKRFLIGGGYRQAIIKNYKKNNYLDLSLGLFYEYELYDKNLTAETEINNLRVSFSSFSQFKLSKNFRFTNTVYFQVNSKKIKDFRLFSDSRLYYDLKTLSFYLTYQNRYHNTPYIDIENMDSELIMGLELNFKGKS